MLKAVFYQDSKEFATITVDDFASEVVDEITGCNVVNNLLKIFKSKDIKLFILTSFYGLATETSYEKIVICDDFGTTTEFENMILTDCSQKLNKTVYEFVKE